MSERLKYNNYDKYARIVEEELKNKKTEYAFKNWILRLTKGLNHTYHPNDLMKLFIIATDANISFPKEKREITRLAMSKLIEWVTQNPVEDKNFVKLCIKYVVTHPRIDSQTIIGLIKIIEIMSIDIADEEWLRIISLRVGTWKDENGEKIGDLVDKIIEKEKNIGKKEQIKKLTQVLNNIVDITDTDQRELTISDLIRLTEKRTGNNKWIINSKTDSKESKNNRNIKLNI
jgi:hypothetical protein